MAQSFMYLRHPLWFTLNQRTVGRIPARPTTSVELPIISSLPPALCAHNSGHGSLKPKTYFSANARTIFHSAERTGCTYHLKPVRRSSIRLRPGSRRRVPIGTALAKRRTSRMSTISHNGFAGVLLGSKYLWLS